MGEFAAGSEELALSLQSRAETRRLGRALASGLRAGDLVVLEGNLGAGKTYLVQAIARGLGVPASIPVTSPTFELVHELPGRLPIVHADLYRLAPGMPLHELGLVDHIGHDAVVLVEWGDRFTDELGGQGVWLTLSLGSGQQRGAHLSARGPLGRAMFARLLPKLSGLIVVPKPTA